MHGPIVLAGGWPRAEKSVILAAIQPQKTNSSRLLPTNTRRPNNSKPLSNYQRIILNCIKAESLSMRFSRQLKCQTSTIILSLGIN